MDPRLVVVGSVAYDTIETLDDKMDDVLGGSAAHFALASQLLAPTGVVAVVGDDFDPRDRQRLVDRGVDVTGLTSLSGKTFRWGGKYDEHLKDRTTLFTHLNVFADFRPSCHSPIEMPPTSSWRTLTRTCRQRFWTSANPPNG